jgi:hypothetical protein
VRVDEVLGVLDRVVGEQSGWSAPTDDKSTCVRSNSPATAVVSSALRVRPAGGELERAVDDWITERVASLTRRRDRSDQGWTRSSPNAPSPPPARRGGLDDLPCIRRSWTPGSAIVGVIGWSELALTRCGSADPDEK